MAFVLNDELYLSIPKEKITERFKKLGYLSGDKEKVKIDKSLILYGFEDYANDFVACLTDSANRVLAEGLVESTGEFFNIMLKKLPDNIEDVLIDRFIEFLMSGCTIEFDIRFNEPWIAREKRR